MAFRTSSPPKRRRKKRASQELKDIPKMDALEQLNLSAAGLDIGDAEIYVAVPEGRAKQSVRCFSTFTEDLHTLADWLEACAVTTVAMESTGVYWIPCFEILQARGIEVYLVNARQVKNVSGRKTDVLDCQWLQQLHTYGLLKASFRPSEDIAALRALVRHRDNLIRACGREIQHMQKALQLMNVKLTNVVSDITGVTGMAIVRAIVAGEHNPNTLAQYRNHRCRKSTDEIARSLDGNYRTEHLFSLKQSLEAYDFYQAQIAACDETIEQLYSSCPSQVDLQEQPLPPKTRKRNKPEGNEPDFDLRCYLYQMAGVDLTQIDGIGVLTAQTILSEIGTDMSPWKSSKHFTSWLGLSPHNDTSGGKVLRSHTRKSTNKVAKALRMSAYALTHSQSALGAYYRRMKSRIGAPEAITATAHKLARIIYAMLKSKCEYRPPQEGAYEGQARQRAIKNLHRKAKQLGFDLVSNPS